MDSRPRRAGAACEGGVCAHRMYGMPLKTEPAEALGHDGGKSQPAAYLPLEQIVLCLFDLGSEPGFRFPDLQADFFGFRTDLLNIGLEPGFRLPGIRPNLFDIDLEIGANLLNVNLEIGANLLNVGSEPGFRFPDLQADFFGFRADLFYLQADFLHIFSGGEFGAPGFIVPFDCPLDFSGLEEKIEELVQTALDTEEVIWCG